MQLKLRRTVFWIHLVAGIVAGLVILMMSVTGVLLTYERQMLARADKLVYSDSSELTVRQPVAVILDAATAHQPGINPATLSLSADADTPVLVGFGRNRQLYINPYNAEVLEAGDQRIRRFFSMVTQWHRWFGADGKNRDIARAITGAGNLIFLLLIFTGIYLWLPRLWRWHLVRAVLLFNPRVTSGKARDYNWHHVFGIWSALPLIAVVATAVVFSYPWANNLVYRIVGEEAPAGGRHGPPSAVSETPLETMGSVRTVQDARRLNLDLLLQRAIINVPDWRSITVALPGINDNTVTFDIDTGTGGQPQKRTSLTLDRNTGAVRQQQSFANLSPGRQIRSIIRFAHTGEVLGVAGQTLAGIVSFTSILMVWTGFALAWRRLIVPVLKKRTNKH
jgi:uncharacterized iron-regulated membrane protein